MTTLVLEFTKIESVHKTKYVTPFIETQMKKQLLMKVILMMYLNQSIIPLYQTYKQFLGQNIYNTFLGQVSGWIIDSVIDHNI